MMKCSDPECFVHDTGQCHKLIDPIEKCADYVKNVQANNVNATKATKNQEQDNLRMPWDGNYLTEGSLPLVSAHSSPIIIGLVGSAFAGRTSYLGSLFTLLQNHSRLLNYSFGGSYTLDSWDRLAHSMKFKNGRVQYPEPTPSNPDFYSLFHLRLCDYQSKDFLFADASGESFDHWSTNSNHPNAGSPRWICSNSNGFIFFIDSDALAKKKAVFKGEILDIAYRLRDELNARPIVVAWSKGDTFDGIPKTLLKSIQVELLSVFPGHESFTISNHSHSNSDTLCHINNIQMTERILSMVVNQLPDRIKLAQYAGAQDYFFHL